MINSFFDIDTPKHKRKCRKLQFKNNTRIFSASNRQKNKNVQPGTEKQHSSRETFMFSCFFFFFLLIIDSNCDVCPLKFIKLKRDLCFGSFLSHTFLSSKIHAISSLFFFFMGSFVVHCSGDHFRSGIICSVLQWFRAQEKRSLRTQTHFRLSLLFSFFGGEKRQPEMRLRSQARKNGERRGTS